ncbi:MAG: glycerophosphodiester phosphodiesterase family protein [Opitutae bacterium]|nr:glycerophosphodiester phosphodiesterase family protein [Opitutae bacterium]
MCTSLFLRNLRVLRLGIALLAVGLSLAPLTRAASWPALPDRILVAMHRADWRQHPENSLPAIRSALVLGADVIEIDVRRTKDGHFVLMHDGKLDRTTNGKGPVADFTLAELKKLRLRDGLGSVTREPIPTLEEALAEVQGRALVNLDKAYEWPDEVFRVVEQAHAQNFAIFSIVQPLDEFEKRYPGLLSRIRFMVVAGGKGRDANAVISAYLERQRPEILQLLFAQDNDPILGWIEKARAAGVRIWINSLWSNLSGGHDDDRALTDPAGAYGWLLDRGATAIQTDRPRELMRYLEKAGLRR